MINKLSFFKVNVFIGALIIFAACNSNNTEEKKSTDAILGIEAKQIETDLNSLLNCYYPQNLDTINGGFYTNFEYDWKLSKTQVKMLVTQSRYLWTASRALSIYPQNTIFRKAADHGYEFITKQMWDNETGGFRLYYTDQNTNNRIDTFKMIYANAFALYALSEYAKINKKPEVLEWVKKTFDWMEKNAHDSVYKGYYSFIYNNKLKLTDTQKQKLLERTDWTDPSGKDQNTSIHLLEALTNVYQVFPDSRVKQRLAEMLSLVRDTMLVKDGYLKLYFKKDWTAFSNKDSSENYIKEHISTDHISFGHNIETAFLIIDASKTLFGKVDTLSLSLAKKMIDHTLQNGFDKEYYGILDKGYLFKNTHKTKIMDSTKVWWAQAEALNALALISGYYPKEDIYKQAFLNMWRYIHKELIDPKNGGWYEYGLDKTPAAKLYPKAHEWKGNYHDGRALMLLLSYSKSKEY